MQQHFAHLFPTPKGITLAGTILAKRNQDGTFAVKGREKQIHAQLQAAYGKPISPKVMGYIRRGGELLAQVTKEELGASAYPFSPIPHTRSHLGNDFPIMAKGLMMFALTGLNDIDDPLEGKGRLEKMQRTLRQDALLKAYGLPTWEEFTKDYSDDDKDEDDDGDDDVDDNDSGDGNYSSSGNNHYNPDEPRIPAGQPGAGQWTAGGGVSSGPGSISADEIRSALTEEANNSSSIKGPLDISPEDFMYGTSTAVVLSDGSFVPNPYTGGNLQMPAYASLQDNVSSGESMANLPSILTDNDPLHDPAFGGPMAIPDIEASPNTTPDKEAAMVLQFYPGQPMDYQRTYPTLEGRPNPAYVDFGNYNYGVVAAAARYTLDQALYAAALVNARNVGNPHVDTSGPNNSNPRNNYFIQTGYNDYTSGKIKGSR